MPEDLKYVDDILCIHCGGVETLWRMKMVSTVLALIKGKCTKEDPRTKPFSLEKFPCITIY